jgi:hypothetical protein
MIGNGFAIGAGEYHPPGRTYKRKPRYKIKRVEGGYVWVSKKGKQLTKPLPTRAEAKRAAKAKVKSWKRRI